MANENGRVITDSNIELEGGGGTNYSINDELTTSNYKVKNTTEFWGGNASSPPEVDLFDICELRKESSTREMNVDIAHTKTNLGSFYVNSYSNSLNYRLLDVLKPWQRGINIGYNNEVALIKGTTPREFRFDKSLTNSHASTLTGNIARFLLQRIAGGGKFLIQREDNQFTIDSEVEISGNYAELADTQNTEYYRTNQLGLPTNVSAPYMMLLLVGGAGGGGSSGTDIYQYGWGGYNAKDVHGGAGGGGGGIGVFVLDFSSCDGFVISVGSGGSGGSAGSKATGGSSGGSGSQNAGFDGGDTVVYAAIRDSGKKFSITKIITCGSGAGGGTSSTTTTGSRAQGGSGGKVTHHDNNTYSYCVGSSSGGSGGNGGASTSDKDFTKETNLRGTAYWAPGNGAGTGQQQYYMTANSNIISTLCATSAQGEANSANSSGYYGAGGNGGSSLDKGAKAVVWGPANNGALGAGGSGGDFGTDGGYAGGKGGDGFFALYY